MKKFYLFLAVGACALLLGSCKGFKSQTISVGDYKLTTSLSESGDTLWTIKDAKYQEIFSIQSGTMPKLLDNAVFMVNPEGDWGTYYSLQGKNLGRLKVFRRIGEGIYTAILEKEGKVLYFQKSEELIGVQDYRLYNGYLGYQNRAGFTVVSVETGSSWTVPCQEGFIWVELLSAKGGTEKPRVVVLEKRNVTVYTVDGEKVKTIPTSRWNKKIKGVNLFVFGKGQRCQISDL